MKYALIKNGVVDTVSYQHMDGWEEVPDSVFPGFVKSGEGFDPPPPDPAEIIATMRAAVQAHIDATAQSRDYDSGATMAGYVNSGVEAWQAEAQAFVAWRDAVWLAVFAALATVEAGQAEPPESPEALIDTLPAIEWPE